jgi:AP endonuclease 2
MKSSRSTLERKLALPDSYDAFFSFPKSRGGYSGVGVYTSHAAAALKAEEGLCGTISNLKPPLSEEESIKGYPTAEDLHEVLYPDEQGDKPEDLTLLDSEGRALTLDFGIFVLINTYCPNETSDARLPFKMNYHLMLEDRVRRLRAQGREVIVVGRVSKVTISLGILTKPYSIVQEISIFVRSHWITVTAIFQVTGTLGILIQLGCGSVNGCIPKDR